ncbi:hypothetical protein [Vibrio phage XZ1]|uniref:Head assembly protein n=3 Tax=Schizotequatrovirus TaxID=1198137 RepID=A0A126HH81_9CAUD|nr:head vertex assembly chaperone [Vibrio phage VH7D]YP_009201356.1 head vertex assembly chaperone [Vibrio phage ValKK3]ALP47200.1 hypothetical protein phiGrn1_0124 [Vibrio phage phi-Grn1]ALP47589.1 head assembly protein [Vibrio phage phi-ST2]QBX06080.1 hypothetical protein Va3_126 [Vibrio phage Va3]QNJ54706.1 hypothetical protein vBValMR10Z_165 [Vibrio phage vB_ValM_R10Z]QNJ55092.1 hypothetical protein vBValMR11Z_166 [Vibrio phage vB_ValM_R11Z]UOL51477.1 hypothetical protein [Vibrio phage X
MTPNQVTEMLTELQERVKFSIMIDDIEVYITDILVDNSGRLKIEFVTQHPDKEEQIRPHVEACIMKLIREEQNKNGVKEQCKSRSRFSQILSKIKSTLLP